MEATLPPVGKDGCSPSQLRFFKVSLASEAGFGSMLSACKPDTASAIMLATRGELSSSHLTHLSSNFIIWLAMSLINRFCSLVLFSAVEKGGDQKAFELIQPFIFIIRTTVIT